MGTPVPRTLCSYTILASSNKGIGELLSPTYPGVYPKNLSCSYKFIGSPGQRVRIEFRDFDVFYGGQQYVIKLRILTYGLNFSKNFRIFLSLN